MLKTAAISGAVAIVTVGLASTRLIGPLGPCPNIQQTITLFTFLISSFVAIISLGGVGLRYLARRFPRE
jgi:hypothetical protein